MEPGKLYEMQQHRGYVRVTISPQLNAFQWADVERCGAEILKTIETKKSQPVLVDLSSLDYLGSSQVALLVRLWKAIKAAQGKMVVLVTTPVVRDVLQTAGLAALWDFAESPAGAYHLLGLQADGRPRMSLAWPIVGMVALAGALAGLCASLLNAEGLDAKLSLTLQLSCSAVALLTGLWTVVRGTGLRRGLGVGMVIASALLAVVEVFQAPR
ncbi:MAG: STAS domain-containing protein [Planctomycetales bacterium]